MAGGLADELGGFAVGDGDEGAVAEAVDGNALAGVEADAEVTLDQVLAVGEEGAVKVGTPVVEGATVVGKVVKNGKGKKLNILTYRPKKGSMVRKGHRQPYTKVEITAING